MSSPEEFRSSPARPTRRIATSPLVISSSPDFPSLQHLVSQPPRPPAFKPLAPATSSTQRLRPAFTSAADLSRETVDVLPSPEVTIHEPHYRASIKETQPRSRTGSGMARGCASHDSAATPILISSPATATSKADLFGLPSSGPLVESVHFKKPAPISAESKAVDIADTNRPRGAPLNIERAPGRRLDWTPPKEKAPILFEANETDTIATQPDDEEVGGSATFTKVLEAFRCSDASTPTTTNRSDEDGGVFRKRKLIDAVSTRPGQSIIENQESSKPKKKAATKKKPRTITGLATAAYKLASQPDPAPEDEAGGSKQVTTKETTATGQKAAAKTSRKRTAKAPRKPKKKELPPKPILLSPSAALRQVANQDFLFGTSSQLAQDHSPRFLRDLATAMKTSNEIDYITLSTPINSDVIEPPEAKRSLWNAAARDEEGDLFDLGVQELAQKSQSLPPPRPAQADPFGYVREASPGDDSFLNLSDVLQPQQSTVVGINTTIANDVASHQVDIRSESCSQDTGPAPTAVELPGPPPRPNFELYTDAQLASAVSSYGFKNVRQRGARIALLTKCWQGRNQTSAVPGTRAASTLSVPNIRSPSKISQAKSPVKTPARPESSLASASQPQEPPPSAQPMSPPKRPRGRPRKTPVATASLMESVSICAATITLPPSTPKRSKAQSSRFVVEIPDSESEASQLGDIRDLTASPCSIQDETFSPSQGVDLSLSMDEDTEMSTLMSTCDKPASFDHITKAITSAPRSKDVANPSWHEKMLMYDPIILEDLTAWLNCGPLTKAGYDDEVSSGEVKKWCESKSICCLWKVNLRGKERKRY